MLRGYLRAGAILSIILAATTVFSQDGAPRPGAAPVVNALPDRVWIAPGQTWAMQWQSAVSPSATTLAAVGNGAPSAAPVVCCKATGPMQLRLVTPGEPDTTATIDVVRYRPLPAGVSPAPKILMFGDSLAEIYLPTALRQQLETLGYAPRMIGTTLGREWNGVAELTEGRGGKQIKDMLYLRKYSPADVSTVQPLPIGDELKYMALPASGLSVVSRKYFNPFLRPASGSRFHGTIVGDRLTVDAMADGFVGLGQSLRLGDTPLGVRIVAFAGGKYGLAGEYVLDHPVARQSGNMAGDECDACVNNGTVFDVRFYLSRFGLPDPDWVAISAGTNDLLRMHAGAGTFDALANTIDDGVRSLHAAFRLAMPHARIVFYNVALGTGPGHDAYEPNHRLMLATTRDTVRALHDPKAWWVNTAIWQSESAGWWVHPEGDDTLAEARAIAALIAAETNPAGHDGTP